MIRLATATAFILTAFVTPAAQASDSRSAHAHEHGHGALNIAIEGNRILMELKVPGADIVGFEHEAKTPEQKAAVEAAEEKLENGAALFTFVGGGCRFEHGHVEGEHDHDHKHGSHDGEEHSEFHVGYEIACDDATNISTIEFPFFGTFAGSEELEVTVIGSRGQAQYEVERDEPRLALEN